MRKFWTLEFRLLIVGLLLAGICSFLSSGLCQQATAPAPAKTPITNKTLPAKAAQPDPLALTAEESAQLRMANQDITIADLHAKLLQEQAARLASRVQAEQQSAVGKKDALIKGLAAKHGADLTKQQLDEAKGAFVAKAAPVTAAPAETGKPN